MTKLNLPLKGSIQNPAWSPDDKYWLVTLWLGGYNEGLADIYAIDTGNPQDVKLLTDKPLHGYVNVSQPGSCWNGATERVIFSTTRWDDTDWPCSMNPNGSDAKPLCGPQKGFAGYEPSWAPNGIDFVFERHVRGQEKNGEVVICEGGKFKVVSVGDCRQPCWSSDQQYIVYQCKLGKFWDLWLHDLRASMSRQLTRGLDATDATFHPDGQRILFSGEGGLWETDIKGSKPRLVLACQYDHYVGAPSWSRDGKAIICEAFDRDPDGGPGTWLEIHSM